MEHRRFNGAVNPHSFFYSFRFTHHTDGKTLSAEISELGHLGNELVIEMGDHRRVTFMLDDTVKDVDGDVLYWSFAPETPYMTQVEQVKIWND